MEGLTKKEYNEWKVFLAANPPEEYEQSETFNDYVDRKWRHKEKLAVSFLNRKGKKHF